MSFELFRQLHARRLVDALAQLGLERRPDVERSAPEGGGELDVVQLAAGGGVGIGECTGEYGKGVHTSIR